MEYPKNKEVILEAIKQALANLYLEADSSYDYSKMTDEDIENIFKKLVKDNKYGKF